MVEILRNIIAFVLAAAEGDLIGYNRLGNNVDQHVWYRYGEPLDTNRYQILQWMMADKTLSTAEKRKWFRKLNKGSKPRFLVPRKPTKFLTNRRGAYLRTMLTKKIENF